MWIGAPSQPTMLKRGAADGVGGLYERAAAAGEIILAGGAVTDNRLVISQVLDALRGEEIAALGADRYRKAELGMVLSGLDDEPPVVWRGSGAAAKADGSHDVRAFITAVHEGRFHIRSGGVMPLLAMRNAALRFDPAGNPAIDKAMRTGRIDLVSAMVIAVGLAAADSSRWEGAGESVYMSMGGMGA